MNDRDRLTQLRVLRSRLEGMPASPERDHMLREVRSRAVDIESGLKAAPVRPLTAEADVRPEEPPRPKPAAAPPVRRTPPAPPKARQLAEPVRIRAAFVAPVVAAPLPEGLMLWLDDDHALSPEPGSQSPWARGLRG
jgi:hypothetical protein